MRIVVDTSTLIRGLLKKYTEPALIVDDIVRGYYKLVMTDEMAKELLIAMFMICEKDEKLNTKKYLRAVGVFLLNAERIKTTTQFNSCSDSEDKMFIECSIDSGVKYCISSDSSIYDIKNYSNNKQELELIKDISFFNPQKFHEYITTLDPKPVE